ncbi:MAG: SAM-dependent methyltransferase [Acutalibacteraceae bacterium]
MKYTLSEKYNTPKLMAKIMGPNPIKLEEELLLDCKIKSGATVCDLGSGQGLTSVFLAKEYGYTVYAADLWSEPEENRKFFREMGLDDDKIIPVKADAEALPFEKEFFDAVISTDSYNYFGRDENYLDDKLLPFVKSGGYIYIAIPGMKKDCHDNLPPELLFRGRPSSSNICTIRRTGRIWSAAARTQRLFALRKWSRTTRFGRTGLNRTMNMQSATENQWKRAAENTSISSKSC